MKDVRSYLINLDRSPERLAVMKRQLDRLPFPWERVPAVDGRTLAPIPSDLFDTRGYDRRHGKGESAAEVGCYVSHVHALRAFLDGPAEFGIICEDDIVLPDNLPALIAALAARARDWDVVKLAGRHSGTPIRLRALVDGYHLSALLTRHTGSACYLVNRRAAARYVERLLPVRVPYDHAFDRAWAFGIRFRAVTPMPVDSQAAGATTIGALTKKKKWYRRGSVLAYRTCNEVSRVVYTLGSLLPARIGR